jgi:transposase
MTVNSKHTPLIPGLDLPLSEEEARRLIETDPATALFVMMQLIARVKQLEAADSSPSAPPSSVPIYKKPTTPAGRKGKTKRGAKVGHQGHGRPSPDRIDRREEHPALEKCPHCDGPVSPIQGKTATRTRIIEDIPEDTRTEITEHTIHRAYCPKCKRNVEPKVVDALPNCTLGHRVMVTIAWLHYGIGVTLSKIREVLGAQMDFAISDGGILEACHRMAQILTAWYEEIGERVKKSGVVHADETGWRVNGKTHWLWCFTTPGATYYMIDQSRGSPALSKFFTEAIDGVLVTDFWAPYDKVACAARQVCFPHLFREIDAITDKDDSPHWRYFRAELVKLMRSAMRLKKREQIDELSRDRSVARLYERLERLFEPALASDNANVRRIAKRLKKHESNLFAFLDFDEVPADNNRAEREIRPAVIQRKNINGNQSDKGARTQAVLMTVFRTLKIRKQNPLAVLTAALRYYCRTGNLPAFPWHDATGE